jgi:hypothetical protein
MLTLFPVLQVLLEKRETVYIKPTYTEIGEIKFVRILGPLSDLSINSRQGALK